MSRIMHIFKKYTIAPIILVMFLVFSLFGSSFLRISNIRNILMQSSTYGIMALGMTFLIINGYFDLSAGVVMGFSANLVILLQIAGFPIFFSVLCTLAVSCLLGAINGLLVTRARINAFIVTLSMMLSVRGLIYLLCKADQISGPNRVFFRFANSGIFGFSYLTITFAVLLVTCTLIMRHTNHGRSTYAVGGNAEAAFNAGINVNRVRLVNFIFCSLTAGISGVLTASRMNGATPYLGYPDGSIIVITCVVLGGTSLSGGQGGMIFTLGGIFAYYMIRNGLNMMNVPSHFNHIITGVILITIVTFNKLVTSRKPKTREF